MWPEVDSVESISMLSIVAGDSTSAPANHKDLSHSANSMFGNIPQTVY